MRNRFLASFCLTAFFVLLTICASVPADAQRSTNRSLNIGAWTSNGGLFGSNNMMFQIRAPYLSSLPPLASSMPYPVIISYLVADSACRTTKPDSLANRIRQWTSWNDTLAMMTSGLYQMVDWDPLRFAQYSRETELWFNASDSTMNWVDSSGTPMHVLAPLTSKFTTTLEPIETAVKRQVVKYYPTAAERGKVGAMLGALWILRVQIESIDSTLNVLSPDGYNRYAVTATVVDTLKGSYFPDYCSQVSSYMWPDLQATVDKSDSKRDAEIQTDPEPCNKIRFEYTPHLWASGRFGTETPGLTMVCDSAFLNASRDFRLLPGHEAIVFLSLRNHLVSDSYDYFNLDIDAGKSYGILRIASNMVIDPNKIWSSTGMMTYTAFTTMFNFLKQSIINH